MGYDRRHTAEVRGRVEVRLRVKVAVGESVRMELSVGITGRVKERVRVYFWLDS